MHDETPSFAPWASRVHQIRTWSAVAGFALAGGYAVQSGKPWTDATFIGLGAAFVFLFVAWASALWICSELHLADVNRLRAEAHARAQQRHEELQALYRARVNGTASNGPVDDLMLLAMDDDAGSKAA